VFVSLGWGYVERVDVIPCGTYKRAFVHFAPGKWNTRSEEAMAVLDALRGGRHVKFVYDDPWFWNVGISSSKRPEEAPKPRSTRLHASLEPIVSNENKVHEHNFNLCECGAVKPLEHISLHAGNKKNKSYKKRKNKKTKYKSKRKRKKPRKKSRKKLSIK
jgi:hypothetical protein